MPTDRLNARLTHWLDIRESDGALKGSERVITGVIPPSGQNGKRFLLEGFGPRRFIRMNANDYLGMAFQSDVGVADDHAVTRYGAGPGAVRFISGTWTTHRALEERLAQFHGRDAGMIFNSAYAAMMSVLPGLIDEGTGVFSDELNHNCIINAIRLAQPQHKFVYRHLDVRALEQLLTGAVGQCRRAVIVTDGVFSMRGDHAPLDQIIAIAQRFDSLFPENVIVVADDSHGVGAFGETGRGTEEVCGSGRVDLLISTLGKAIGVNGGYVVAGDAVIRYLREVAPFYIYSNPIGPGEAAAAHAALDLIDSPFGVQRLAHLRSLVHHFKEGLIDQGFETVDGEHPVVALVVRDTPRMNAMVDHLVNHDVIATGLGYPVVPRGEEEIRFQLCADHTLHDLDLVLGVLATIPP